MSKKYWILWAIVNLIMGFSGYVLLVLGFMVGLAKGEGNVTTVYVALAITGLILLFLIYLANRIFMRVICERSEQEIPKSVEPAGNLLAWAIVIILYLIMSFL